MILNHGDHAYLKVRFDELTLDNLMQDGLHSFQDDGLTRFHVWLNLWHQVQDGEMSSQLYMKMILQNLPQETDEDIIVQLLESANQLKEHYLPL